MRGRLLLLGLCGLLGACMEGGGGGERSPSPAPVPAAEAPASPAEIPADLTRDLAGESRDYVEAYARAPWVHANVASKDWGRARQDLAFIRERLTDLGRDEDVRPEIKARLERLTPWLTRLDAELEAESLQAVQTAAEMVVRFTTLTNHPQLVAWLGLEGGGGGGGPYRAPEPRRTGE